MGIDRIFGVSGSALNAQSARLNTVASNLANANSVASSESEAFRAKRTVFKALVQDQLRPQEAPYSGGVKMDRLVDDPSPVRRVYEPGNPLADGEGYVYSPNIDPVAQMVNMISSARSFQANVEVFNTAKELAIATINIGR